MHKLIALNMHVREYFEDDEPFVQTNCLDKLSSWMKFLTDLGFECGKDFCIEM